MAQQIYGPPDPLAALNAPPLQGAVQDQPPGTPPKNVGRDVVIEKGRAIQRIPGAPDLDLGDANEYQTSRLSASDPRQVRRNLLKHALNPEAMAAIVGTVFPETAPVLLPAGVAAGTTVARDVMTGDTDPLSVGGDALAHGAVNTLPGLVGKGLRTPAAIRAANFLPTTGITGTILKHLGLAAIPPAEQATAPTALSGLADMTIDGKKVMSTEGLQALERKLADLDAQIKFGNYGGMGSTPPGIPQQTMGMAGRRQALASLIQSVKQGLGPNASPQRLIELTGSAPGSLNAQAAANRQAQTKAAQESVVNAIRRILGVGSVGNDTLSEIQRRKGLAPVGQ